MRMIDLAGKEIVNIYDGARMGMVGESDMLVDGETGRIYSIIIPRRANLINFWVERQHMVIPWEAVRKVGNEVIIVDLDETSLNLRRHMA